MNSQPEITDTWTPCEPGQLQALAERLRGRRSPSAAKMAGVTMAACIAAVLTIGLTMNTFGKADPPPIGCREVVTHLAAYADGGCEPELRTRIERHLARCHRCAEHLDQALAAHAPAGRLELLASLWGGASLDATSNSP